MKNIFRKIATVTGTALMLGSSVAFAAAASYPAPFVANGSADVAVVYGASAATSDSLAAINIATDLNKEIASQATTGVTTVVTGGDSYKLEKSSTKFQLGNYAGDVVSTKVTDDNLPTLLKDGIYVDNDNDEFDYTQKIDLVNTSLQVAMFDDNDYKTDAPTVGIKIASGAKVLSYTLDMTDDPEWADLATSDLPLMGRSYYVLGNSTTVGSELTLLDSASDVVLAEGETTTVTVDGKAYEVSINFVSETETKLTVNGETTNSLEESETYKLSDGSYLGIKDIMYSSKDSGVSKVELSIGKGKLKLTNASDVELNEDTISGLTAYFTNDTTKLTSIVLEWEADDDLFVAQDSSAVMPGFGSVKLSFGGLTYSAEEAIKLENDGDDSLVLSDFALKDSTEDINLLYFDGDNFTVIGKDAENKLVTSGNGTLTFDGDTDEWFVASWNDTKDSESYLVKVTNFKNESGKQMATFQYRKNGAWADAKTDAEAGDTVTLGSVDLTVVSLNKENKVAVINAGSDVTFNRLYSKEGMAVQMPYFITNTTNVTTSDIPACSTFRNEGILGWNVTYVNNTAGQTINCLSTGSATYTLNLTEENKDGNLGYGNKIVATIGATTDDEVKVSDVTMGTSGTFAEVGSSDVFRNFAYSALATEAMWDKSGDQYKLTLTYHGEEVIAAVYLTSADATVTSSGSELGGLVVTDANAPTNKNLIVVGGSAINSVAAELLGGALKGEAFTAKTNVAAGEFLIKTFARNGKVATLVAGYNAEDTTKAATYLINNAVDTTVGSAYKGTSATEATMVVA